LPTQAQSHRVPSHGLCTAADWRPWASLQSTTRQFEVLSAGPLRPTRSCPPPASAWVPPVWPGPDHAPGLLNPRGHQRSVARHRPISGATKEPAAATRAPNSRGVKLAERARRGPTRQGCHLPDAPMHYVRADPSKTLRQRPLGSGTVTGPPAPVNASVVPCSDRAVAIPAARELPCSLGLLRPGHCIHRRPVRHPKLRCRGHSSVADLADYTRDDAASRAIPRYSSTTPLSSNESPRRSGCRGSQNGRPVPALLGRQRHTAGERGRPRARGLRPTPSGSPRARHPRASDGAGRAWSW
jgi:hypothetical protein